MFGLDHRKEMILSCRIKLQGGGESGVFRLRALIG